MSNETNEPRQPGSRDAKRRMRIGDAERDALQAALSEHLAAGRLDMQEYERRVEQVTAAVFADDLDGLLDDLPPTEHDAGARAGQDSWGDTWRPGVDGPPWARAHGGRPPWADARGGRPPWSGWVRRAGIPVPLLIALGFVALFALPHGGWVLFPLLWFMFFAGAGRGMCGGGGHHRARDHGDHHAYGGRRSGGDRIEV